MQRVFDSRLARARTYRIRNKRSGMYLTVVGFSKESSARLVQFPLQPLGDDSANRFSQVWFVMPVKGRRYLVSNLRSFLFMYVISCSVDEGALVEQSSFMQSWSIVYEAGYVLIQNSNSNLFLGVVDSSTAPGAAIQQGTLQAAGLDRDSQLWAFEVEVALSPQEAATLNSLLAPIKRQFDSW